jgi:hypothetical protein
LTIVDIHLLPELLEKFISETAGTNVSLLKLFPKQNDWKGALFPAVTAEMQRVAQQIWSTPFCGVTHRLHLQEKVFELLALQLQPILADQAPRQPPSGCKPETTLVFIKALYSRLYRCALSLKIR